MARLAAVTLFAAAAALPGCATLTVTATQAIEVEAADELGRPVHGMVCRIANDAGEQIVTLPAGAIRVRRSSSELEIECRLGAQIARGTAVARGDAKMENAFIPGGSIAALVDYLSGYMYTYPTPLKLRVGKHLRFGFSDAVRAELIASLAPGAPVDPLPAIETSSMAAQIAAPSTAMNRPTAPPPPAAQRRPKPRKFAAAAAARPAVKYESLDPRDLRLRAGVR